VIQAAKSGCHVTARCARCGLQAHLLEAALTLAYDPVAAVRMRLAAAMPALRAALALPDDVHLLERLNSGMSHLITDGDADVRREARKVAGRGAGGCLMCITGSRGGWLSL
jgi:hypothetical protein